MGGRNEGVAQHIDSGKSSLDSKVVSESEAAAGSAKASAGKAKAKVGKNPNNVRRMRIERMMSKAELSRRANLSVLTIDRVEKGFGCRMDTKRKILEALGLSLADRVRVFGEEE
jgi:DNA-binding XRE family transcriptional regulator